MHGVVVAAKGAGAGRDVIGDDPVAALAGQLGSGVFHHIAGLCCEAHD